MTPDNTSPDGEDQLTTSRRGALVSLAVAGLFTTTAPAMQTGSTTEADVGGGSMSDELSHRIAEVYRGPASDLEPAGVQGRYYHITDGDGEWNAGDLLEDTGDSWERLELGVNSFTAGSASVDDLDINQLASELDAAGYSIQNAGSVSTDGITVGGGTQINKLEFGQAIFSNGVDASSDSGMNNANSSTTNVSFANEYETTPRVFVSLEEIHQGCIVSARNIDTDGFEVLLQNYSETEYGGPKYASWLVMESPP